MSFDKDDEFEKDEARRVVEEITVPIACKGGQRLVYYSLFRRRRAFRPGTYRWEFVRHVLCRESTFEEWLRGATKLPPGTRWEL